ncbi:MAG: single-stranded-DNA-specific exonuclease RecJ [Gammaproteobacteria bacterium]|nr:single-stranded-DNA-specific exonuclease RecJ [Gammaproteobacteria bacterium]
MSEAPAASGTESGDAAVSIVSRPLPAPLPPLGDDLPPLLRRVYAARGVTAPAELDRSLRALLPPDELTDADRAAERLARAVMAREPILVVGDFDADGATAVALSVSLLGALGAEAVDFLVPNRFEFGYGLSPEIVELAVPRAPRVLVTVDNGVSSVAGVAAANAAGIDVIVTDHHLPGATLPDAYALVNPNRADCAFASKALAGVGVIYYVLGRVRTRLREAGWFDARPEPNLADWLDLVALGTVADVVPLDANNRVLVHQGLARMRAGRCRPGIRALADVAGRRLAALSAQDLGFALGPRLNAAGRLEDMTLGIRCLLAATDAEARERARALDELNRTRRALERDMVRDAELLVAGHPVEAGDRFGVCVYEPGWHQGIVGIVAGRLREKIHRPVVAFAEAGPAAPDELKGSARSLPDLHVRDALDAIAARYPGLLMRFGGHAMAAGLSIKRVHYDRFARAFDAEVARRLPAEALTRTLVTDGTLAGEDMNLATARALAAGGPWGQGFPEPLFHGEFEVVNQRVVGEDHLKLVLRHDGRVVDAIAFRQPPLGDVARLRAAYRLNEYDYGQTSTLQLVVEHIEPVA